MYHSNISLGTQYVKMGRNIVKIISNLIFHSLERVSIPSKYVEKVLSNTSLKYIFLFHHE